MADPTRGIREFIIGTGGASHYSFRTSIANSEVRNSDTFSVLKLTLHPNSYHWQFVPEAGKTLPTRGTDPVTKGCRLSARALVSTPSGARAAPLRLPPAALWLTRVITNFVHVGSSHVGSSLDVDGRRC